MIGCADFLTAVTGDDLYPAKPDIEGHHSAPRVQHTSTEARLITKQHHRFEFHSPYNCELLCNVQPSYSMPSPVLVDPV